MVIVDERNVPLWEWLYCTPIALAVVPPEETVELICLAASRPMIRKSTSSVDSQVTT